eukprot:925345-Amphidinium_carterae.2
MVEHPLPPFIHQVASTNLFTGEKIPARDVKPDLSSMEAPPVVTAATVVTGVTEFADFPTPAGGSQPYPMGLGNVVGLTPEPQPNPAGPCASTASSSRAPVSVKLEPRAFTLEEIRRHSHRRPRR